MKISLRTITLVTMSVLIGACSSPQTKKSTEHEVLFLEGSNNNKLEVLDWGGNGEPMLFLAGMGDNAHVFDDFAPRFTDKYHVYGLTRRGFGASAQTEAGYDTKTLAEDILPVLNTLHIHKVILVGHSIAGQELSRFASIYPDRVEKIIYLDAAYNFALLDSTERSKFQQSYNTTSADSASIDKVNQFYKRIVGVLLPVHDLEQGSVFSRDGKYLRDRTPDAIYGALFKKQEHMEYTDVKCPALAIYATHESKEKFLPFYTTADEAHKKLLDSYFTGFNNFENIEINRFKNGAVNGKIQFIPDATHYIFACHPDETEKLMRDFL